jgi:hypothetical protein
MIKIGLASFVLELAVGRALPPVCVATLAARKGLVQAVQPFTCPYHKCT